MKKIISLFLCVVIFSVANITATADENIITGNLNDTVTYKYNISSCVLTFSGKGDLTLYSPRSTEDNIITKGNIGSSITYYINEMCLNAKTTYFNNGYKNAIVCKKCKEVIKVKSIKRLELKTPKLTVKAEKNKITVKYTKVKDSSGFEVRYKANGKWKTKTYNTKKSLTKSISLKSEKYKVQIRAFVKKNGKTAYSKWTKSKTVKVK